MDIKRRCFYLDTYNCKIVKADIVRFNEYNEVGILPEGNIFNEYNIKYVDDIMLFETCEEAEAAFKMIKYGAMNLMRKKQEEDKDICSFIYNIQLKKDL